MGGGGGPYGGAPFLVGPCSPTAVFILENSSTGPTSAIIGLPASRQNKNFGTVCETPTPICKQDP